MQRAKKAPKKKSLRQIPNERRQAKDPPANESDRILLPQKNATNSPKK